jgi:uncharacterized protein
MEINVSQQLKASIGYSREYEVDDPVDILGIGINNRVRGSVKLIRTNRGILVKGKFETQVPFECSRCLNVFDYPLDIVVTEEYFPVIDVNSGSPIEIPDEPGNFIIDEHHILDLNEAIRQSALLAIPMKPLCRQDCAGLCQVCGKDLNQKQCNCEQVNIDPRWSKLAKLAKTAKKINRSKKEME